MDFNNASNTAASIGSTVVKYLKLLVEDTKLNATEKLVRLFSAVAICAICFVLGIAIILFLSLAAAQALSEVIDPVWGCVAVAGFYAILALVLYLCRTALIINPISRFLSRLLLDAPENTVKNDTSTPIS